jgi:peptide/nickel transport system permease protein
MTIPPSLQNSKLVSPFTLDELEAPPLSLGRMAWLKFRRHKMALVGVGILVFMFLYCTVGGFVFSEKFANYNDTSIALQPPSAAHIFGTDVIGRDILARTIYGGQISLLIGLIAVMLETTLGILVGAASGYFGGLIDNLLMRFTETIIILCG